MTGKISARLAALLAAVVFLQSCSITRIEHGNGERETTYALLAPINQVNLSGEGTYVETRGLGATLVAGQTAIGAFDVKALNISPECRLVVITPSEKQIEALRDLLKETGPLCSPAEPRGKP